MPGACGILASGFALDCDAPIIAGVEDDLLLANFSDIDFIITNATNPTLITHIQLKQDKQFYRIEGRNESAEPLYTLVQGRYVKTYDHQVTFKLFSNLAANKEIVDTIKDSCLVALIKGKDGVWEVYGKDLGMRQSEGTRNPIDADTGGAHNVVIKTAENAAREPHIPSQLLLSDALTTDDVVASLQTAQLVEDPANLLPDVSQGVAYNETVQILGGTGPYTFETVTGQALPAGLSLAANGNITGTTNDAIAAVEVIIKVTDATAVTPNESYIRITLNIIA